MTAGCPGSMGAPSCAECGEMATGMTAAGFRRLCNGLMREPHCRAGMAAVLPWNRLKTEAYSGQ